MQNKLFFTFIAIALLSNFSLPTQSYAQSAFSSIAESKVTVGKLLEGYKKNPRSDTYYLMALADARKGNYELAERSIKTGLQINPRNTKLMNLKGALLSKKGRLVEARRMFLTVLQLDPENEYAETSLATIEKQLRPEKPAVIVTQAPKTPNTRSEQPMAPVVEEKLQPQKKILEASYFSKIKKKQKCYYNMTSLERAFSAYLDSAPKDKEFDSKTLAERGLLPSIPLCPENGSYSSSDNEITCTVHGKRSEVGSEVTTVFIDFNRGMKAKLSRNYLEALRAFEQVVVLYPQWAEARFQFADTLFRLGEIDPAIVQLRQCLKYAPENLDAKLLLANLYFKKGQKQAALQILDQVATGQSGTVYGLAARSIAKSIRSGRNYYQIFPPN